VNHDFTAAITVAGVAVLAAAITIGVLAWFVVRRK